MTSSNGWKVVLGEDGKEYYEVNAQVVIPQDFSDQTGTFVIAPPSDVIGTVPELIGTIDGMSIVADASVRAGDAFVGLAAQVGTLNNSLSNILNIFASPPPPIALPPAEPPPPSGRFENLDLE